VREVALGQLGQIARQWWTEPFLDR
jgi:hypothetical protein